MDDKHYIIIDIETTWLSRSHDRIIEIAAVRFDGSTILDTYQTLINPQQSISSFISSFTWITNGMVANAPTIQEVLPWFLAFLQEDIFVAHNATFDHGFITTNTLNHLWYHPQNDVLCTRKLANRLLSHLPSKSLGNLCAYYGIVNNQAHRALADVLATTALLKEFLAMLDTHTEQHDLFSIQKKSVGASRKIFGG
jgi:DNA polymerase III epsilon subunit family exonuclease